MPSPERAPRFPKRFPKSSPESAPDKDVLVQPLLAEADRLVQEPVSAARDEAITDIYRRIERIYIPGVTLEEAGETFGEDFLGPEALTKAFGVTLKPEDIPAIPFSREDLEKAKELRKRLLQAGY